MKIQCVDHNYVIFEEVSGHKFKGVKQIEMCLFRPTIVSLIPEDITKF